MEVVSQWSFEKRLGEALRRTLPKLGPEARTQLEAIINPVSLGIVATVLVAWIVSHAFGVGEVIDIIVLVVGVASMGFAIFAGVDHLYDFASGVYRARHTGDLELAAEHLAKAIGILGVQAVLALLFRGARAPRTGQGGRLNVGTGPRTPGLRYRPTITQDPLRPAGHGITSIWGDIKISSRGSQNEQAVVLLHERVHQFLTPKLYLLRNYRVSNQASSYMRSSLWRYIEEALAETIAQVGVNGFSKFFHGIKFPIQNGYLFLRTGGGYNPTLAGHGLIPEGAALIRNGSLSGIAFELWFQANNPSQEP